MTSHHMDSDAPGLSALKHLFMTAFVFEGAKKGEYKLWLTVKPSSAQDEERWTEDFRLFMEKFSDTLGITYDASKLAQHLDDKQGTVMFEYAFPAREIEQERIVETLSDFNIGYHVKDSVGIRFLELGREVRDEGEKLTQQMFERNVLEELHLATGIEWTVRENAKGGRSYEPLLPVPNAYGALMVLCSKTCLNLEDHIPEKFQSGAGMIRIPVEDIEYENYAGLKGKDISAVFKPAERGRRG
jgi:hypothetical protein